MIIVALKKFGIIEPGEEREVSADVGGILIGKGLAKEKGTPDPSPKPERKTRKKA